MQALDVPATQGQRRNNMKMSRAHDRVKKKKKKGIYVGVFLRFPVNTQLETELSRTSTTLLLLNARRYFGLFLKTAAEDPFPRTIFFTSYGYARR